MDRRLKTLCEKTFEKQRVVFQQFYEARLEFWNYGKEVLQTCEKGLAEKPGKSKADFHIGTEHTPYAQWRSKPFLEEDYIIWKFNTLLIYSIISLGSGAKEFFWRYYVTLFSHVSCAPTLIFTTSS
jgi:hypothetical protein